MPKLKKFNLFVDSLYPSELTHVLKNNSFEDEDIFSILAVMKQRVEKPEANVSFDAEIDPRKYSKLIRSFKQKLDAIDVDSYFAWISRINHLITIDNIPPNEQAKIIREMESFQPGWFHVKSFYDLLKNYEGYLLRRLRKAEYQKVKRFLKEQKSIFEKNDEISNEVTRVTERVAFGKSRYLTKSELTWLLHTFRDEKLSKKIRYEALLAYMMHHINQKDVAPLIEPMNELEVSIFNGHFYSRRILANFYANKLIVKHTLRDYDTAIFCGNLSIKHHTQDHLYYLNNFVSSLLQCDRYEEALQKMRDSFREFKLSRDLNRKTVFMTNYCRSLNLGRRFTKSVSMSASFVDEFGKKIFEARWHYFFRTYFHALLALENTEKMIKLEKKFDLLAKEKEGGFVPFLQAMIIAARFREIKLSQKDFLERLNELTLTDSGNQEEFSQLLLALKANSVAFRE